MNLDLSSETDVDKLAQTEIESLTLDDFRCYPHLSLELSPSRNILLGPNGSGKTSVLEALYLVATTTSFRTNTLSEVIRRGCESAHIAVDSTFPPAVLEIQIPARGRRTARINGTSTSRVSSLIGILPIVCFSSQDLQLISGDPGTRRRFLDREISQLSAAYLDAFSKYKRVLSQRNALLKAVAAGEQPVSSLDPWDERLAELGEVLRERRQAFVNDLSAFASHEHENLSGGREQLQLSYKHRGDGPLRERLMAARQVDLAVGSTTVGPHREDFEIVVNDSPARSSASQGQQRTAVLAIQLGLLALWRKKEKRTPILLLDDILSDLDESRRQRVLDLGAGFGQVLLTATDAKILGGALGQDTAVFRVEQGTVTRE
ncbi:MAG: DNA replication and repair protein RecF [Fimbriimonadales bacterium]|nr:MAG: DNA replication and repair protein RecF [Fimbriimonadales bacterium]